MNIQQIEYIVAVDRLKSFTKAADSCYVTQATLSGMVKKLEEELNVIIFDRKTNPILTTEVGMELIEEGKIILSHYNNLKNIAKQQSLEIEGTLKIGIIPTIANSLLPKIIKPFLLKYPNLYIEILEITTNHIIKQLKEGIIDVGIVATTSTEDLIEEEILYHETLMVYGEVDKQADYLLPEEIKNNKIWLLEEGHCLREQFIKLCTLKKKEFMPNNLSFDANSFDTLLNMVDEFGGLTLIPELYFQGLPPERKEKVHVFKSPLPVRKVSIVYYRPFAKQRTLKILSEFIKGIITPTLISQKYTGDDFSIVKV